MDNEKYLLNENELDQITGGVEWYSTDRDRDECDAAMERTNGKRCKFCHKVFDSGEVYGRYFLNYGTLYNTFVDFNNKAIPCFGCGYWRFTDSDFE